MKKLQEYADGFKLKYEIFMNGCDAIEDEGAWNKEKYGEMEAFYTNDLVSVVLRLIASDGKFTDKEVEFINDVFGFEYKAEELVEIYENQEDDIENILDEELENAYTYMKTLNEVLAEEYKELIALICDIIIASDGELDMAEVSMAEEIKANVR